MVDAHPVQSDETSIGLGYQVMHGRVITRTELLPALLKELGLSQHVRLFPKLLTVLQDDYTYRPTPERSYNLTDICQRIQGPSFDSWFRPPQPHASPDNAKLLKHFAFLLHQRKIIVPARRDYRLRPDRKAMP